ncbi:hypothetical protein [Taklimakanibacter albus]|uniref:Uncharacterized protein n=1 Tax=Taklimakanibacter albus TaxID=2800327 RepID=A0ACC5QY58_9HYPH|nr:hypothetical protein [Aestuariivirga sp. YIM B02566]MBK1865282.1 hypothetical protein [Aestuariivirga sp. YIM B02566]
MTGVAKTIMLGKEYDEELKARLVATLISLGAVHLSSDWAVAGSQELAGFSVSLSGEILKVESETYVGLSIFGPAELVDEIIFAMNARQQI